MKSALLLASVLALASCADFWGFDSTPVDTEEDGERPEAGDAPADTPAEAMDGEEENGGQCTSDRECSDGEFCNGQEICSISGRCEAGEHPFEGTACNTPDGAVGRCSGGICVTAGCGNGFLDGNEECDDGNDARGDGCEPDCATSCHAAGDCLPGPHPCVQAACEDVPTGKICRVINLDGIECEDGDACTEGDLCLGGACVGQVSIDCFDGVDCTMDTCEPDRGCVFLPMDELCDDDNPCTVDSCISSSGTEYGCTYDLMPEYCLIDGDCVPHLQQNPGNECLVCNAYADATHWSDAANGAACSVCVSPCPCGGAIGECVCCNGVCGALHDCPAT